MLTHHQIQNCVVPDQELVQMSNVLVCNLVVFNGGVCGMSGVDLVVLGLVLFASTKQLSEFPILTNTPQAHCIHLVASLVIDVVTAILDEDPVSPVQEARQEFFPHTMGNKLCVYDLQRKGVTTQSNAHVDQLNMVPAPSAVVSQTVRWRPVQRCFQI